MSATLSRLLFARDDDDVDKGKELLDLLHDSFKSTAYDSRSVIAGLILSLGGTLLLFVIFCLIRPRHNLIYAPRLRYVDETKKPKPLGGNLIHWIWKVFAIPEDELVDKLGIDAAVFVRFMTMLRNMFIVLSVLCCGVAIPVNIIYNQKDAAISKNNGETGQLGVFGLMTPITVTGKHWIFHIALAYILTGVVLTFLWLNFRKVVQIRRKAFMTKEYQNALFMRTLLVTEVPKKYLSEQGLANLMSRYRVNKPIQQINVGKNVKELTKLLELHEAAIFKLEKYLAKYLKNPSKLPANRPTCKPVREDRQYHGKKVDAIDYYIKRTQRLEKQINVARDSIDNKNNLPYGLVSYTTPEDCHTVAKHTGQGRKQKMLIQLAPRANDIIWSNMVLNKAERKNKTLWGMLFYLVILVAWIVPNAFIGCFLTDLSRIGQLAPGFATFQEKHKNVFSVLQGFLAPVVTTLVFMVLPTIMRRSSQWQGRITKTEREHDVTLKLFVFFFFNNFFVVTMISVAWNIGTMVASVISGDEIEGVSGVTDAIKKEARQMSTAIIRASSFWVMYLLRANIGAAVDLLQAISLFWGAVQRYILSPTPRQLMLATAPQPFQYAAYYNWLLFYASIALAFTSIQPLVLPILAFYLCIDSVNKKYMLMYMFVTKTESDGRFWPLLNNCLLFATAFGNLVILAVVWTQSDWKYAVALGPLPFIVIIFKIVQAKKFNHSFHYFIPTTREREMMEMSASMANTFEMRSNLEERYLNPAISSRLPVPMVHAKAEHMLRDVCNMDSADGNDEFMYESNPFLPGSKSSKNKKSKRRSQVGGNKFDIVQENELDYEHYQRIAEGSETATEMSVYSSPYTESKQAQSLSRFTSKEQLLHDGSDNHSTMTPPPLPVATNQYYQQRQGSQGSLLTAPNMTEEGQSIYSYNNVSQHSLGYQGNSVGVIPSTNTPTPQPYNPYYASGQHHSQEDEMNLLDDQHYYGYNNNYGNDQYHQQHHW